jgi:hypothetical protein
MDDTQGDLRPQETTDAPEHKPSGDLGGHPVNADETAPRELMPDPGGAASRRETGGNETPESVDDEPGSDL